MRNSTTYKLSGTKTFRRASSKILGRWGSNLQNIEKSMREVYEPDGFNNHLTAKCSYWLETGDLSIFTEEELFTLRVFLQTDQSGAEALIVAYDCDPKDYRQLFIHNVKPHVYVALKLFLDIWKKKAIEHNVLISPDTIDKISNSKIYELKNFPEWRDLDKLIKDSDNWSLQERYYYLAKQTCHSANYDIQAQTFRMNLLEKSGGKVNLPMKDADYFLNMYRGLFPEIPERNRRVARQVEETGIIYNMFGFPYQITNYNLNENNMKEYFAWLPQSTVGEITRKAVTKFQTWVEDTNQVGVDVLADTHDSFLVQCRLIDVVEVKKMKQHCMNQELVSPIDVTRFNMKSECNCGFNWNNFKKEKNILGLQEVSWS